MKKIYIGKLILSLAVPLLTGMLSAALSYKGMAMYGNMDKPPLSPPSWVFSVAWTILYLMMGLATYYIWTTDASNEIKKTAIILYAIQLVMNFMWSIVFFNFEMYLFAFIWLVIMLVIVIVTAFKFFVISRTAAYLMIPYIVWLCFAAYLNFGSYILKVMK